jgi:anti-sigma regulatory factor (Ser/Thr protein kinase)
VTAAQSIELELPAAPASVARARDGLDVLRGTIKDGLLDDVRLLVSEIVTNSVRHAGLGPGDQVVVRASALRDRIRVEVADPGPGFDAPRPGPVAGAGSGWGLFLVEHIADRWGVDRSKHRTRVWFEIDW